MCGNFKKVICVLLFKFCYWFLNSLHLFLAAVQIPQPHMKFRKDTLTLLYNSQLKYRVNTVNSLGSSLLMLKLVFPLL